MVKNRTKIAKSGTCISMLFGALPWQHMQFECDSCARIYKQGPMPAFCNTSLLKIPKLDFLPTQALNSLGLYPACNTRDNELKEGSNMAITEQHSNAECLSIKYLYIMFKLLIQSCFKNIKYSG